MEARGIQTNLSERAPKSSFVCQIYAEEEANGRGCGEKQGS